MSRPKRNLTKINLNLPTHVLEQLDVYAEKNGITRTAAILTFCVDALGQNPSDSSSLSPQSRD